MPLADIIKSAAGSVPFTSLAYRFSAKRPLVVLYHGVRADGDLPGSTDYRGKHVPVSVFERQIDRLGRRFRIVPLAEIEDLVLSRREPARPTCAITFDDGYRDVFEHAWPILARKGLPSTIFVTTGFLDRRLVLWTDRLEYAINHCQKDAIGVPWPGGARRYPLDGIAARIAADSEIRSRLKKVGDAERLRILGIVIEQAGADLSPDMAVVPAPYAPLAWDEVREMARSGMAIGAHTVSHPILSGEPDVVAREEIVASFERIRTEIGEVRHFAYPNGQPGDWNDGTLAALAESSIKTAWTTVMRRVDCGHEPEPLALPRIALDRSWEGRRFEALVSDSLPRLRRMFRL